MGKKTRGGTPKPTGRPSKLNGQVLAKVLQCRRLLMSIEDSAAAAGITAGAHEDYMRRGKEDDAAGRPTIFAAYFREVPIAEAEGLRRVRQMATRISLRKESRLVDINRARLRLEMARMADGSRQGWERLRIEKAKEERESRREAEEHNLAELAMVVRWLEHLPPLERATLLEKIRQGQALAPSAGTQPSGGAVPSPTAADPQGR